MSKPSKIASDFNLLHATLKWFANLLCRRSQLNFGVGSSYFSTFRIVLNEENHRMYMNYTDAGSCKQCLVLLCRLTSICIENNTNKNRDFSGYLNFSHSET